jgi:DNA polymerase-3 subunit gamma/tau
VAYVSLYRKYRPQTFAEVVGQAHVTQTLAAAVTDDRLHHAYLFTGPRGTGKTSTARILAKSLNCEHGPTAEPCGRCVHCTGIIHGSSVDVIEIDAASHGGVDDVRDLRERVAFAPASARMKVYIVDECHMLSTAGWNAFLKTVEEPPGHVVFVFATTEPHKVLDTILSRTQRFDFKRIGAQDLGGHVADLGVREGLTFEPGAVDLIVRAGDGSARDALSVLDQVVAFTGSDVTVRGVAEVLGTVPDELLARAVDGLAAGDVAGLCVLVGRLADGGLDLRQFARDAVEHLRCLLLLQVAPDAGLVEATPERVASLQAQAARLGRMELLRAIELLAEAMAQMRRGNTRLPLELALVKAALPEAAGDPGALAARLDRLERRTGVQDASAAVVSPASGREPVPERPRDTDPSPDPEPVRDPESVRDLDLPREPAPAPTAAPDHAPASPTSPDPQPATAPPVDLELVRRSWDAVLEAVKARKRSLQVWLLMAQPIGLQDDTLQLEFRSGYGFHADNCAREDSQEVLGDAFAEVFGTRLRVACSVSTTGSAPDAVADDSASLNEQAAAVLESEAAAAAGQLPDEGRAHDLAIETLTRDLGAKVIDDGS